MKSNMKKFLALFLSLSLVLAMLGDFAQVKAADSYIDVTLTETSGWDTSYDGANNQWVLYLKGDGHTSTNWAYKYEGFTIECNGVIGETNQVSTADGNRLYCTIPSSVVPAQDGVVFTIKAGTYEPDDAGTTAGLNILNDFTVVAVDGRLVHTTFIDEEQVEAFNHTANSFYFSTKDLDGNVIDTGFSTWDNFLSPAYCDGTRIDTAGWTTTYSGVFIDGQPMDYWGSHFKNTDPGIFYIDGLNAVAETRVTVKGLFASSVQNGWALVNHFFIKELNFIYNGSEWSVTRPVEYKTVTLTETDGWSTSVNEAGNWEVYLKVDGYETDNWACKYVGFDYECNGVAGTATEISSAGKNEAGDNRLWCPIPTSAISSKNGTVFTIKAGEYAPTSNNTRYGIKIAEDFDIVVNEGRLMHTTVLKPDIVETFNNVDDDPANCFYFSLKDADGNGLATGCESWTNFLSPAWCDGTRVEKDRWSSTYTGVWVDGTPLDYWEAYFKNTAEGEFYIKGLSASKGTKVVVRGVYNSATQDGWDDIGDFYLPELTFTYDGSNWNYVNESEPTYTDYTGTPIESSVEWDGNNGFYFETEETDFPYDANGSVVVTPETENDKIYVADEPTDIKMKKVGENRWYVCIKDAGITLEDGDAVSVLGTFVYDTHRITFEEEFLCYYTAPEVVTYEGTPVLHEQDAYGNASGFYFSAGDGVPKRGWNEALAFTAQNAETDGVFIKTGTETTKYSEIHLQKVEADIWYIKLSAASNLSLAYGDVVTIKGNFVSSDGTVVTFNEASFQFNGKHFSQGTFTATEFTITELYYNDCVFDENNQVWNLYFNPSVELPGDPDQTYYPYMTYEIDDIEYESHWFKSSSAHNGFYNLLIQIPAAKLRQNLEETHVITLKESAAQGRTSGTNTPHTTGIRLTKEFIFVVGDKYEASAPAIDYGNTGGIGSNGEVLNNNLWVTTQDDFPITSWTYSLKKADENSGIFVRNSETGKYESTDGTMKRHQSGAYYVSDFGTVETGDIIMLKGTFSMSNLHFITFGTARYQWTGEKWIVYSEIEKEDSTGIDGDARGDNNLNSADLVRMIKFMGDNVGNQINLLDADLNATGDIDEYDIRIERKLLLGLTLYQGEPTYKDDAEMRLAAFVAPKLEEGFDYYSNAGFTTIIGEQRAVTEATGDDSDQTDADEFDAYMKAADDAGLDVLVQSGAITNMINGAGYDKAKVQSEYEKASAYSNFRGFFMADEPAYSNLNMLEQISSDLRQLANEEEKKMDLFIAGHPMYTENEIWDATAGLSDSDEYYKYAEKIGKSLGEYTYDFYPFRNKQNYILGFIPTDRENYIENQWLLNLKVAVTASRKSEGAFDTGMVIQSYSEPEDNDYLREVGPEEISAQVYAALAYGMKSLNYFTFGEHWDQEKAPTDKCMYQDGAIYKPIYDAVTTVNTEIKKFDHVMLQYNWVGTMGISGDYSNGNITQMDADGTDSHVSKRISTWSSKLTDDTSENADTIIGCLKDLNGYDGFMIVNVADPTHRKSNQVSVTFKETLADGSEVVSTHATVYENGEMTTKQLDNGTFTATLSPGQGIFVIPYIQ